MSSTRKSIKQTDFIVGFCGCSGALDKFHVNQDIVPLGLLACKMSSTNNPIQFSFPVPKNPYAILHGHLTMFGNSLMVHLTTTTIGESSSSVAPIGSFVYAMPDRNNTRSAINTSINVSGSSIDYATRLSKILAIRLQKPVYVGCSMNFAGLSADEEMEGLTKVVQEITRACN